MPIRDLAVRFQDTYRVRLGDMSGRSKSGKPKPVAFDDRIRITAPGREAPQAFADVYGSVDNKGVTEWLDDKSPDCFEVYLPITALPIWILPGQVLTQWWELYRGSVCDRRCEGTGGIETISGEPCKCSPDIDKRIADSEQCNIMTRLSVMCPDVPQILGSGSLVTHSRIAAETFQGAIYQAGPWLSKNVPVAAVLRSHTHKGRTIFTFPNIEVGGPVDRTPELDAGEQPLQIEAGVPATPALERGVERPGTAQADAESPAAPPAPFDSSNEKIVDPDTARALKIKAYDAGLTAPDLAKLVQAAAGTNIITKVHVDKWPAVVSAINAAIDSHRAVPA